MQTNVRSENRRDFLKVSATAGAVAFLSPTFSFSDPTDTKSRVIIVEDSKATTGNKINTPVVQIMVDEGIKSLTQISDLGNAWKSLFPGVSENSKIGIKVNCINSALSSHPEVAYAIANGLKKMMFGATPFNENNIIIYERTEGELRNAKYTLNKTASGIRVVANNSSGVGYSSTTWNVDGSTQKISKVVTEMVDYFVNLAVLKNHGSPGVTLCLKNHLGTCNDPGGIHNGDINKKIAQLNSVEPIKTKQKVFIIDALYGIRSGGPGGSPQFTANKLIIGSDIVAVDYWGKDLLAKNGCKSVSDAKHIDLAATSFALGTNNPANMEVVNITSPSDSSPSVSVLTPNGGEKWNENSIQKITWSSKLVDNIKIEYSSNNGTNWNEIVSSVPASNQSYDWKIPNSVSKNCKVRISDLSSKASADESNAVFEIVKSTPVENEPDFDNEIFEVFPNPLSDRASIRFQLPSASPIRLELTDMNGFSVDLLYNGFYPAGAHNFEFNAAHIASGAYILRLKTNSGIRTKQIVVAK